MSLHLRSHRLLSVSGPVDLSTG